MEPNFFQAGIWSMYLRGLSSLMPKKVLYPVTWSLPLTPPGQSQAGGLGVGLRGGGEGSGVGGAVVLRQAGPGGRGGWARRSQLRAIWPAATQVLSKQSGLYVLHLSARVHSSQGMAAARARRHQEFKPSCADVCCLAFGPIRPPTSPPAAWPIASATKTRQLMSLILIAVEDERATIRCSPCSAAKAVEVGRAFARARCDEAVISQWSDWI
jgi:hypothetical protein